MSKSPVVVGLSAVFIGLTTLLLLVAIATGSPFVLVVAVPLGVTAAIMWYHATGRLEAHTRARARRAAQSTRGDGGAQFGDGRGAAATGDPRRGGRSGQRRRQGARTTRDPGWYEDGSGQRWYVDADGRQWRVGPEGFGADGRTAGPQGGFGGRGGPGPGGRRGPGPGGGPTGRPDAGGISERTARERLEVGPDAGEDAITEAYREKVKEVHPDAEDGDAERFKAVNEAYERLVE